MMLQQQRQCRSVAVIYGSDTSEWEISCRSGEYTAANLDADRFDIYEIFARHGRWSLAAMRRRQQDGRRVSFPENERPEVDKTDFSVEILGEKIHFDYTFIMQHGAPGETGQLQGYLEMLGIPFSSCSSFVSAVAFDKYSCKSYLRGMAGVKFAPDAFVRQGMDVEAFSRETASRLGFPLFVKPTAGGSSFGITKVHDESGLPEALSFAFSEGSTVIVEKAVKGREITCAVYSRGPEVNVLPLIEIVPDGEYFDYDAKYNGLSREICPADLTTEEAAAIRESSRNIYMRLGCAGLVRIDYILSDDGLYFLEINTIPGMTSASLVPKMVHAAGLDMTGFLSSIIDNS